MKPGFARAFGGRVLSPATDTMIDTWRYSVTETVSSSDSTSHAIDLPGLKNVGDILLLLASTTNGARISDPAGWTPIYIRGAPGAQTETGAWMRVVAGGEGSTVTLALDASRHIAAQVHRISGAVARPIIDVAIAASATTSTPNPPNLVNSWGAGEDTLWLAGSFQRAAVSVSAYPSDYSGGYNSQGTGCTMTTAIRILDAASEDPGAYSMSGGNTAHNPSTVAVCPITEAAFGGPQVRATSTNDFTADTTSHAVDIPAVTTGERILVCFVNDGNATVTVPSGYTEIISTANGTNCRAGWYYRDVGSDASATTVDFVTSASEHAAALVYVLQAGTFDASQAPAATANTGNSTTPGFAANSPSWGTGQTLFLASIGCDNTNATNRWSDAHWIAPTYAQANASAGCTAWCSGRIYRAGSSYTPGSQQATQRQYVAHNLAIKAA